MVGSARAYVGYPDLRSSPSSSGEISCPGAAAIYSPEEKSREEESMSQEVSGEEERVTVLFDSPAGDPESKNGRSPSPGILGTERDRTDLTNEQLGGGTLRGTPITSEVVLEQIQPPEYDASQYQTHEDPLK